MRNSANVVLSSAAALFFLALPALAVDGTILNGTTGKTQSGVNVTLFNLTQNGPEAVESVKSDTQGKFTFKATGASGPRLLEAAYEGITYNHMLPPGMSSSGITVEIYDASKSPGNAAVTQHMVLFEPSGGQMKVSETYIYGNTGKTTYVDPKEGTIQFYLPKAAQGIVRVNCTEPQGMPIQQAAEKTRRPNVYKIAFPIKPGDTRIDLAYILPWKAGGTFEGKILYKGGPTRLVAPVGVTLKGDGIENLGQEPTTQASIYDVKGPDFKIEIEGSGTLSAAAQTDNTGSQDSGPSLEQIMPKLFGDISGSAGFISNVLAVKWILLLAFGILTLGFIVLYRAQAVGEVAQPAATRTTKEKNERRRG